MDQSLSNSKYKNLHNLNYGNLINAAISRNDCKYCSKEEINAINFGILDYNNAMKYKYRKPLLCVTFLRASMNPILTLHSNMMIMENLCDWAIIIYDGTKASIESVCNNSQSFIYCRKIPLATIKVYSNSSSNVTISTIPRTIPKTVMYRELLPFLSNYQRVFLLDEDISLLGFDINKFTKVWNCAFYPHPPPLIVQPLIAESNQYFGFVNLNTWVVKKRKHIIATASGLVEQQTPLFDSIFLQWYISRVLIHTKDFVLKNGVDWGHDRSWCGAAKMYSKLVLNRSSSAIFCAIITGGTPVHHLNTRSMIDKRKNRTVFRLHGRAVVAKYMELFPTWTLPEILNRPNPLSRQYGKGFKKSAHLNHTCVENQAKS
eukprot:gene11628-15575_t